MIDERVHLSVDEAIERLEIVPEYDLGSGVGPHVHCRTNPAPGIFIGAHWPLADVRALFEQHGAQEAGPLATRGGYGVACVTPDGWRFFETRAAS